MYIFPTPFNRFCQKWIVYLRTTEALKYYGSRLSEYERVEIEKYPEIWYLGLDACKIHGEEGLSQNGGFDDDNGSYNKVSR